jgi:hypothetical protein
MKALGLTVCLLVLASPAIAQDVPSVPDTPSAVIDVVFARPFTLEKGYKYDWSKDRPIVSSGTLVVLKVDPAFVYPRNAAEPVLYVGDRTAQRLNRGHKSGHVVAIVPGKIDLARAPIWFGRPELPERVTAQTIRSERAMAEAADIKPFAAEKTRTRDQDRLRAPNLSSLLREHVAKLVLQYSPQEKDLVETWRLPVAKARPKPR